jgi:hypothetical protein
MRFLCGEKEEKDKTLFKIFLRPILCILNSRDDYLTGFKPHFRRERRAKSGTLPVVAVLCLVLLALLAVVQVAHFHSNETVADHCPLCISMHTLVPAAVAAAVVVLVQVGAPTPIFEERTVVRNWNPKLFTRPPPAGC